MKILKALAERNGSAGFTEIRDATGLSTGSIYYNIERMDDYIIKHSKVYIITERGMQLLKNLENNSYLISREHARRLGHPAKGRILDQNHTPGNTKHNYSYLSV